MSQNNGIAIRSHAAILPDAGTWKTMLEMADALVKSGMLPSSIKTPQAAVAIMQKGVELRIDPMYALSNIVVIQGKPTANSELMLALIYRDHGDNAIIFTHSDSTQCEISYKRRSWPKHQTHAFTMTDAKQASLLGNQTWQKYPAAMLRARCISAVARMAFPDSIGGLYSPDELGADVDVVDGDVVVVEQRPRQSQPESLYDGVDIETGEIVDQPVRGIVDVLGDELDGLDDLPESYFDDAGLLIHPALTGDPGDDVPTLLDLLKHSRTSKRFPQVRDFITQIGMHIDADIAGVLDEMEAKLESRRRAVTS